MANKNWKGTGGSDDVSVAANWDPSGVPVSSDTISFAEQAVNKALAAVNTAFVALTAVKINSSPNFVKNVGASGTRLLFNTIADIAWQGRGSAYIGTTGASPALARVHLNSAGTKTDTLNILATFAGVAGSGVLINVVRGILALDTGCTFAAGTLIQVGSAGNVGDTSLDLPSG